MRARLIESLRRPPRPALPGDVRSGLVLIRISYSASDWRPRPRTPSRTGRFRCSAAGAWIESERSSRPPDCRRRAPRFSPQPLGQATPAGGAPGTWAAQGCAGTPHKPPPWVPQTPAGTAHRPSTRPRRGRDPRAGRRCAPRSRAAGARAGRQGLAEGGPRGGRAELGRRPEVGERPLVLFPGEQGDCGLRKGRP